MLVYSLNKQLQHSLLAICIEMQAICEECGLPVHVFLWQQTSCEGLMLMSHNHSATEMCCRWYKL